MLWLLTAAFIELLDVLFNELFDAVFAAFLNELLEAVFLELLDNFAATTLPRKPALLTCFDLEEALDAWTFGRLDVDALAVFGFDGAAVFTSARLLCAAAGDASLLVDFGSNTPRSANASPRTSRAFVCNESRLALAVEVE
jgi:hypothetical protein